MNIKRLNVIPGLEDVYNTEPQLDPNIQSDGWYLIPLKSVYSPLSIQLMEQGTPQWTTLLVIESKPLLIDDYYDSLEYVDFFLKNLKLAQALRLNFEQRKSLVELSKISPPDTKAKLESIIYDSDSSYFYHLHRDDKMIPLQKYFQARKERNDF